MNLNLENRAARARDEQGFILVVTMLILVVLTVVGIAALDNSTFEIRIAANDRLKRVAFNMADGASYSTGKIITEAIENGADPAYANLSYVNIPDIADLDYDPDLPLGHPAIDTVANNADDFSGRVLGFSGPRADGKYDFMYRDPNGRGDIFGRIESRTASIMPGGGAEFAAGAAGAGVGSTAGTAVLYDITATGVASGNARSDIEVRYRKVLGAAGGL